MAKVVLRDGELIRRFQTRDVGGHGVVTGTVRLATADEYERFQEDEFPKLKAASGSVHARAVLVARFLKDWDVEGADGKPVPPTADNVFRLPGAVQNQFLDIVLGYVADPFSATSPTPSGS